MAELPESWGLTPKVNTDTGKVDIVGKDDLGQEYVARSCDGAGVTDNDVEMLRLGDREHTNAAEFVRNAVSMHQNHKSAQEKQYLDELEDAALPVALAGSHTVSIGLSGVYKRGEAYFKWKEKLGI